VIMAGCILAPDLSEFDALHGHTYSLTSQITHSTAKPSIAAKLPSVAGDCHKPLALLP
jgi:hypothetical protein